MPRYASPDPTDDGFTDDGYTDDGYADDGYADSYAEDASADDYVDSYGGKVPAGHADPWDTVPRPDPRQPIVDPDPRQRPPAARQDPRHRPPAARRDPRQDSRPDPRQRPPAARPDPRQRPPAARQDSRPDPRQRPPAARAPQRPPAAPAYDAPDVDLDFDYSEMEDFAVGSTGAFPRTDDVRDCLILVQPYALGERDGKRGPYEYVETTTWVLQPPPDGFSTEFFEGQELPIELEAFQFSGASIVAFLKTKQRKGQVVVAIPVKGEAKRDQTAPWIFETPTPDQIQFAARFWKRHKAEEAARAARKDTRRATSSGRQGARPTASGGSVFD